MLRFGIIGVGRWAQNYEKSIKKNPSMSAFRLFAGVSAKEFYGTPPTAASILSAIKLMQLDGVILACDPFVQESVAPTLIDHNIPLILEKPLATNLWAAIRIKNAYLKSSRPTVLVNHFHLFEPSFLKFCDTHEFADLSSVLIDDYGDGPFRRSLAPLFDWGPHAVGIVLKITDRPPLLYEVQRKRYPRRDGRIAEQISLRLEFANGVASLLNFGNGYDTRERKVSIIRKTGYPRHNWRLEESTTIKEDLRRLPMDLLLDEFALAILHKRLPRFDSFKIGLLSALALIDIDEGPSASASVKIKFTPKFHEAFQQL